jgi:hypothetical protein
MWYSVPENCHAIVILCHGITVDATEVGMFLELREILHAQGFGVIRFDYRCHGISSGAPEEFTLKGEQEDLETIISFAENTWDKQIAILGSSFACSSVIANTMGSDEIPAKIILWNPVVNYEKTFLESSTEWAASILATRDAESLPNWAYASIPNTKYYLTKKMVEEIRVDKTHEFLESSTIPILIFHGTKDTYVPFDVIEQIAHRNENIQLIVLPDEEHGFPGMRDLVYFQTTSRIKAITSIKNRHSL